MKKEETIERYGEAAYEKILEQSHQWHLDNPEKVKEHSRKNNEDQNRKGGKHYLKNLRCGSTGLRGERNRIRMKHRIRWRQHKNIIAPDSQLHHQWLSNTADYTGLALVEKDQHMHGIIDVIQILDGEITVFTEKELRLGCAI